MRLITITFIILIFSNSMSIAQDTLSLNYCHELAIENYEISKNKALLKEAYKIKLDNIKTNYLPKVDLNAQATYQSDATSLDLGDGNTGNPQMDALLSNLTSNMPDAEDLLTQYKASLDVSQMIYDGGITKASNKYEEVKLQTDIQSIVTDLHSIKNRVNVLYFSILLIQEQEKALLIMKKELSERINNVESGVKNGIVLHSDLQNLKAEKLKLEQNIDNAVENKLILKQNLLYFIEYQNTNDITFTLPEINIDDSVKLNRPEQQLFDLQAKSLEVTQVVLKKSKNPKIVGFGQLGYGKPGINMLSSDMEAYYIVGAKLSWNILDWNKNKNERQILSITQQQIQNSKEAFEKNIQLSVNQYLNDINRIEKQIEKDEEIIQLRSEITKTSASQVENGTITSTDYLSVLNAETQARITLQTHIIQLKQAKINYLTSLGNI
jgi:outer membrane protein TolC